jgi:hypothetical protein
MLKCAAMALLNGEPRRLEFLAAALILIFLVQAFLESRYKSVTSDEPPHIASGLSYLEKGVFRPNLQHPPLIKELAAVSLLLAGIRLPATAETELMLHGEFPPNAAPEWAVGNQIVTANGPDRVMTWARAPMLLVSCLMAAVLFLLARQLVGGWAALAAVFLCTMDPTILGHSYLVTNDIGLTAFVLLFLLALCRYVEAPTRGRLVWCGVALGLMLCAKFSGVLLLPVAGFLLVAAKIWPAQKAPGAAAIASVGRNEPCPCGSGKKYKACHGKSEAAKPAQPNPGKQVVASLGPYVAMCGVAIIVIALVYLSPGGPLLYLKGLIKVNADHDVNYAMYLHGALSHRFISYFGVAWLLKEPIATVVLAITGLIVLIRNRGIPTIAKMFLLAPPAMLFVSTTLLADDLGLRYIMAVLPFAHILGGLALATLMMGTAKWARAAAAVSCIWVVVAAFGVYPDRLAYFNESACLLTNPGEIGIDGGTRCGPAWLDDSNVDWGQGLKQLKDWQDRHAPNRTINLVSFWGFPPDAYGLRYRALEMPEAGPDFGSPGGPPPGLYALSAHIVARIPTYPGVSDWLRRNRPTEIVGHSIYVYDVPEKHGGAGGAPAPAQ